MSLILSYSLFHNKKIHIALSGCLLSIFYSILYLIHQTFAQMTYEIYSSIIFLSIAFRDNDKVKSHLWFVLEFLITLIFGLIFYIIFKPSNLNYLILFFDFLAFIFILVATMLSGHQNIYQFYFYIPSSILLIILGTLIHDNAIIFSSVCFLVADTSSLVNWKLQLRLNS